MANPLDERMHPVGGHAAWSESYYFNFVDPTSGIGMFTRMGFRPGDGWADGLHVVYLGGDRVAFTYGRRDIATDLARYDGDLRAGDLELVCVVPFRHWEVRYDGSCQDVADAAVLMERRKARPAGWYRPARLRMRLDFDALSDPHYAAAGERGHFEQTGHVRGRIEVIGENGTETFQVDGFGVRDKSWGPRDWGIGAQGGDARPEGTPRGDGDGSAGQGWVPGAPPAPFVNWFSMNFGADLALGGSCFRQPDGSLAGAGWIHHDGRTEDLLDARMETEYAPEPLWHTRVRLTARTAGGAPIRVAGRVLTICPTKIPSSRGATFVNEGLAEFTLDGRTGHGISEHWHRVAKAD
jgi:hypothetical protein